MSLRLALLAFAALTSFLAKGQFIEESADEGNSTSLISEGIANCLDALVYINEDSIDTTTLGTGPTRTIEGIVSAPANATGDVGNIYYAATITRETTSAVTNLVVKDICTFRVDCSSLANFNWSCGYEMVIASPTFEFSDAFYGTATDMADLATTWDGEGTAGPSAPTSSGPSPSRMPMSTPTGTLAPASRSFPRSNLPSPPPSSKGPWPYPTVTTPCPTCPTTTVTVTSTIPCAICEGGITVTVLEQCLTLQTNWFNLVPITTRTITEKCECEEQGGTTVYVVTEPCGPIKTSTECPESITTEDCDCEEETTTCETRKAVPTTTCTTTPIIAPTPTTTCTTPVIAGVPTTVIFKGEASKLGVSSLAVIMGLLALALF